MTHPLAVLNTLAGYRRHFMDAALWEPYVRLACRQHTLPCPAVRAGLAGTFPTFICGDHVIKFFGTLFGGKHSFEVERTCARLLADDTDIPVPALHGEGTLEGWDYLIFDAVPGKSLGEDWGQITPANRLTLARWLGEKVRRLHALPLGSHPLFPAGWESYSEFLHQQYSHRDEKKATLPLHISEQLTEYLFPPEKLVPAGTRPHLVHADITGDHLLGRFISGEWQPLALIDFGDARVADLYYELAALHTDLFRCDRKLLKAFLAAYGFELPPDFAHSAMSTALLHKFDILTPALEMHPEFRKVRSLPELADSIWKLDN